MQIKGKEMSNKTINIEQVDNGVIVRTQEEITSKSGMVSYKEKKKVLVGNDAKKLMSVITGKSKSKRK